MAILALLLGQEDRFLKNCAIRTMVVSQNKLTFIHFLGACA